MTQNKAVSNEQLAALLKQLIIDAPEFKYNDALGAPELSWLGRGAAYLEVSGTTTGLVSFRSARSNLNTMMHSREALLHPLYEAYSRLELVLPSSIQGAFIPGGEPWQGYSALVDLLQKECNELMIVDPYLSSSFFTELAPHAGNPSRIRCLTARQAKNHAALLATANRWATDHSSGGPKIEVRYAKAAELHDRRLNLRRRSGVARVAILKGHCSSLARLCHAGRRRPKHAESRSLRSSVEPGGGA